MKNEQNAPKIRFKGFTDAWEQREVSDVAEITAGGTPSTSVKEYWNPKQVPWLSSGEVHKKYITYTDDKISEEGLNHSSARMIKENSVLIALAGQGKTRGTVAINRIPLSTNQSIAAMTFTSEICPEFIFSNLENRYDELRRISSGDGTRGGLNKQLVGDVIIPYTFLKEQQAIGKFFTNLDHLITLHQRKCETLQKLKKSMLQKMFPKNGSYFPEIRFAGFTDAWELRKLSLSFDILQNNTLSRSELSIENGAARNVHYGDILVKYGEVLDLKTEELPFIQSSQTVDKLKGSFLQNGDIIMADTAEDETAGKCTEIANLDNMNVLAGLHTIPLRPKQKYAVGYLGYYMNSGSFHDKLLPLMQGTKVTSISKSALQGMSILRPADLEEQRQIGTYFRTLDRLITLHQRKLETLKKLKKAMLQKMFI